MQADSLNWFTTELVGVSVIATCQLCGAEFLMSEINEAPACCEALAALKEWARDE